MYLPCIGFFFIALAVLELKIPTCLYLPSARLKDMCHYNVFVFSFFVNKLYKALLEHFTSSKSPYQKAPFSLEAITYHWEAVHPFLSAWGEPFSGSDRSCSNIFLSIPLLYSPVTDSGHLGAECP